MREMRRCCSSRFEYLTFNNKQVSRKTPKPQNRMTLGKNIEEEEMGVFLPTDKITILQYKNISMIL